MRNLRRHPVETYYTFKLKLWILMIRLFYYFSHWKILNICRNYYSSLFGERFLIRNKYNFWKTTSVPRTTAAAAAAASLVVARRPGLTADDILIKTRYYSIHVYNVIVPRHIIII